MKTQLIVYEKALPKARPRMNTATGRAYTPKTTKEFEEYIRWEYQRANLPSFEDKPIKIQLSFYFEPPMSWSNKKKNEAIQGKHIPTKSDLDNLVKAITDALNKVAYADDRYICQILCRKLYGIKNQIIITIDDEIL